MKTQIAISALVLAAFAAGWLVGRGTAGGADGDRLVQIEQDLADVRELLAPLERGARRAAARDAARDAVREVATEGAPSRGPEDAAITIVEFTDYQCPYCRRVQPTIQRLFEEHPDKVRHVIKHNPLAIHPQAPAAAAAAVAAARQGRFWDMHRRIFENARSLDEASLRAHARALGLDMERFEDDFASDETKRRIERDQAEAVRLGATGTPAFFINGRLLSGAQPYAAFKARVDEELAEAA